MIQLLPVNDTSVYNMWWDSYPYSSVSVRHPLALLVCPAAAALTAPPVTMLYSGQQCQLPCLLSGPHGMLEHACITALHLLDLPCSCCVWCWVLQVFALHPLYLSLDALSGESWSSVQTELIMRTKAQGMLRCRHPAGPGQLVCCLVSETRSRGLLVPSMAESKHVHVARCNAFEPGGTGAQSAAGPGPERGGL